MSDPFIPFSEETNVYGLIGTEVLIPGKGKKGKWQYHMNVLECFYSSTMEGNLS